MEILRTPEERFARVMPEFASAPHYIENSPGYEESAFIIWTRGRRTLSRYLFACTANQPGAISIGK
jgi:hypothetical protein